MNKILSILLISLLVISLNTFALAKDNSSESPSGGAVVTDILFLRPLGFAGLIVGKAAFVASLPITIPFNSNHEAAKVLVMEPYRYTFERPLGEMEFHGVK